MSNASSEEIESFGAYEGEEDRTIDATIILGDYVEFLPLYLNLNMF